MILSETKYTEQDYEGLVQQLLQSPDIDAELHYCTRSILNLNPAFYLMMFRTVGKMRDMANSSNDKNLIAAIDHFEGKLYEYTNVFPADLPDSILRDRLLLTAFLNDHTTITFRKEDWREFQDYIHEKADSIQNNLKLPFLKWCINMLEMNLARHNKKCTDPVNCSMNQGYDRRLQFILKMVEDATPQPSEPLFVAIPQPETMSKSTNKIQWLGTQKELAELFIRLKAKGWITDFEPETIKDCFTNANSIQQYLKPGEYTEDLGGTFEQVFTSEYAAKFHGMIQNPKRD